jgi:hypothetical protein
MKVNVPVAVRIAGLATANNGVRAPICLWFSPYTDRRGRSADTVTHTSAPAQVMGRCIFPGAEMRIFTHSMSCGARRHCVQTSHAAIANRFVRGRAPAELWGRRIPALSGQGTAPPLP